MREHRYGVLWDMDGVLVDSGEFHFQSWVTALREHGFSLDREQFRRTFGMNNAGIIRLLLGESDQHLETPISERKEHLFRQEIRGRAKLLPGVSRMLDLCRRAGFRQAVASSGPPANIDALIEELMVGPFFDALVSGAAMPGKPAPDVFLEASRTIGIPPSHCIVVEDAIAGVQAARNAGMSCIAVTTTNPREALTDADIVVDTLEELDEQIFSTLLPGFESE